MYWEGVITSLTWKHILLFNPLKNSKWLHKQSYDYPMFKWEKVLSHHDLTCLQTSECKDALNTHKILHTLMEVPVQVPQHLFQVFLGKESRLSPADKSKLNCLPQRERLKLWYMYL